MYLVCVGVVLIWAAFFLLLLFLYSILSCFFNTIYTFYFVHACICSLCLQVVTYIQDIVDNGYAYESNGSVYFNVQVRDENFRSTHSTRHELRGIAIVV